MIFHYIYFIILKTSLYVANTINDSSKTKPIMWTNSSDFLLSGEPFITEPDNFINLVEESIKNNTGLKPELSTSGGTSDARFIKDICNVIEFGLVGKTMHQIDESIKVEDLELLTNIYYDIIKRYHQNIFV